MYCEKCGAQINDDATFCRHCGNKVSESQEVQKPRTVVVTPPPVNENAVTWRCIKCGTRNGNSRKNCSVCGTSREAKETESILTKPVGSVSSDNSSSQNEERSKTKIFISSACYIAIIIMLFLQWLEGMEGTSIFKLGDFMSQFGNATETSEIQMFGTFFVVLAVATIVFLGWAVIRGISDGNNRASSLAGKITAVVLAGAFMILIAVLENEIKKEMPLYSGSIIKMTFAPWVTLLVPIFDELIVHRLL